MKYIALLRGINVGGNNKVSMTELKSALTDAGFADVRTYINSGNVLFESDETDVVKLTEQCEHVIEKKFGFPVACVVLSKAEYQKEIDHAPNWWGDTSDKNLRSDALFVLRHGTAKAIIDWIGEVNPEVEKKAAGGKIVFWTVDRRKYTKARFPKIIGTDVYRTVSMRSSTTTRKLYLLLNAE